MHLHHCEEVEHYGKREGHSHRARLQTDVACASTPMWNTLIYLV